MKAVLLVGGEGTRLRPLTSTTPKPMLPIAGEAFVDRQLAWLARHGVTEVVLAVGYRSDAFLGHFGPDGEVSTRIVPTRIVVEDEPLGTAGAIRFAVDALGLDERVVVCNGDVLTTLDLGMLVRFHDERRAEATIHLTQVEDPSAFGVVTTGVDGAVSAFVEKPAPGEAPTDWVNAGTYVLEPSVLARIPRGRAVSIERETFPALLGDVGSRGRLYALGTADYWLDMGTPAKYRQANRDVIDGCLGLPPAPDATQRSAGVWTQPGATVADDAVLEAPVLVGRGSVVGNGATVSGSMIGARSVVGDGAVVADSVLLDDVRIASGIEIHDSIIGAQVRVGPTAATIRDEIVVADLCSPSPA